MSTSLLMIGIQIGSLTKRQRQGPRYVVMSDIVALAHQANVATEWRTILCQAFSERRICLATGVRYALYGAKTCEDIVMATDLDKLSRDELVKLISDAEKALKTLEARRMAEAKRAAEKAAQEYGFRLDDVVSGGNGKGSKGNKGAPKYAHPENPAQTWTGRGRQPNWVKAALDNGMSLDDLKI